MPVDGQNSGPQWLLDVLAHPPGGREEGKGKGKQGRKGGGGEEVISTVNTHLWLDTHS